MQAAGRSCAAMGCARSSIVMQVSAIQDFYPDDVVYCYGCGRLNEHGLHIRSAWDGDETVCATGR